MKKALILAIVGVLAVVTGVIGVSAFEAWVINVTATIENALYVHPESRDFGTMFPQEYAEIGIFVSFSQSFSAADQTRVSNVDYQIVQKPKPRPEYESSIGISEARAWCHDNYPQTPYDSQSAEWTDYLANCYPMLCPYLSKHPDNHPLPSNDTGVSSFHDPFDPQYNATGTINKNGVDVGDTWTIDLAVPCFEGECSQDWPTFVHSFNPDADPEDFMAPEGMSGEVFGCDLWFEVTQVY